ncbi:hypothetical protein LXA43DRAFT_1100058 [Ganoderma leucocontextum]|nr:hypothetical protein LXA43DRAFT_1100058 [Ganoderma leucocontextum]
MGRMKWRLQEWLYFEELAQSTDGKDLLARGDTDQPTPNWWKDAVRWFVAKYKEKLDYRFDAETAQELAIRQKLQPRAKQELHPAETEAEWKARIATISKRVGSYIKAKSPNRERGKSSKSRKPKSPAAPPPSVDEVSITDLVVKSSSEALPPPTNGYQLFRNSDHPSRPQTAGSRNGRGDVGGFATACAQAYKDLPDREVFELEARKLNAARHSTKELGLVDRNVKLGRFLPFFKKTYETMAEETGWVGWFLVGGIDEHSSIVAIHDGTAAREDETFEQYLAKRTGCSVSRLRTIFDDFLRDMFDPPRPVPEATLEVPDTAHSPSSHQSASSPAPSPEHAPVATTFSSNIPTTPQPISTTAATPSLGGLSPTALPAVSPAASLHAVPQVSFPDTAIPHTTQPSDVAKEAVNSNSYSLGNTPQTDPAAPMTPSTPSILRSPTVATSVETPSKAGVQPRAVLFGSAPDRVLTTAPPKSKTSRSRRTTKHRNRRGTEAHAANVLNDVPLSEPTVQVPPVRPASRQRKQVSTAPAAKEVAPVDPPATSPRGRGKRQHIHTEKALYQREINQAKVSKGRRMGESQSEAVDADEEDGGNGGSSRRLKRKRR